MKRKNNLYDNMYKIENIKEVFNEICRNTKNKRKVQRFMEYKGINITRIYNILKNREYVPGPYNRFTIYEPKERKVVSQNMIDKAVNHLVSRYILMPALLGCLIDANVASREEKGTHKGIELYQKYRRICNSKYKDYYVLKCDISKFFYSIDHDILKEKLQRRIKDKDALKIVYDIIDSEKLGLGIGNMTSQILAIFYLNDMDHFIKEELKIKYYVRYQDDFVLFSESKEYLKFCLKELKNFLKKERLKLNNKTRIYKNTNNFIFLGRNNKGKYAKYRYMKRRLNSKKKRYYNQNIKLINLSCTILSYKYLSKKMSK